MPIAEPLRYIKKYLKTLKQCGVYELFTLQQSLYVGKSRQIQKRVLSSIKNHSKNIKSSRSPVFLSVYQCKNEIDATLLEIYLINRKKPQLNKKDIYTGNTTMRLKVPKRSKPIEVVLDWDKKYTDDCSAHYNERQWLYHYFEEQILPVLEDLNYFEYGPMYRRCWDRWTLSQFISEYFTQEGDFNSDKFLSDIKEIVKNSPFA